MSYGFNEDKQKVEVISKGEFQYPKMDLLFGSQSTWVTTDITLAHPFTDYDVLIFVYSHSGESASVAIANSYVDCKPYPVPLLKNMLDTGLGAIALFGYSTRFVKYQPLSTTTLKWIRNGDSGTTGIIEVWGLRVTQRS